MTLTDKQLSLVGKYCQAINTFHDCWVRVRGTDEYPHGWVFEGRVGFAQRSKTHPHRLRVQFLKVGRSPYLGFPPGDSPYEQLEYTPDHLELVCEDRVWEHAEWWFPKVHLQQVPGNPAPMKDGESVQEWMWRHMVAGISRGPWSRRIKSARHRTVAEASMDEVFWVPSLNNYATRVEATSGDILLYNDNEAPAVLMPRVGHLWIEERTVHKEPPLKRLCGVLVQVVGTSTFASPEAHLHNLPREKVADRHKTAAERTKGNPTHGRYDPVEDEKAPAAAALVHWAYMYGPA